MSRKRGKYAAEFNANVPRGRFAARRRPILSKTLQMFIPIRAKHISPEAVGRAAKWALCGVQIYREISVSLLLSPCIIITLQSRRPDS